MKILIGLGNPERRYDTTRHNAGFRVVDTLATKAGAEFKLASDFKSNVCKTTLNGHAVLLVKPVTYMNLSGQAVQAIVSWFKAELSDLLIIHDDVSLPLGRIRLQNGGGAGGQHGLESIIGSFGGTKNFDRIKVGVGPDPGGSRRADFVLSAVPPVDAELFESVITRSSEAAISWLDKGFTTTANFFNGLLIGVPEALRKQHEEEQKRKEHEAEERKRKKEELETDRLRKEKERQEEEERQESEEKSNAQSESRSESDNPGAEAPEMREQTDDNSHPPENSAKR